MSSTTDKAKGVANKMTGKIKQTAGKALDDKEMQADGVVQEIKGKAQVEKGKVKDTLKHIIDGD